MEKIAIGDIVKYKSGEATYEVKDIGISGSTCTLAHTRYSTEYVCNDIGKLEVINKNKTKVYLIKDDIERKINMVEAPVGKNMTKAKTAPKKKKVKAEKILNYMIQELDTEGNIVRISTARGKELLSSKLLAIHEAMRGEIPGPPPKVFVIGREVKHTIKTEIIIK